jgi:hypothetical protein
MTHIHWVVRGTGIPKDRDEVTLGCRKRVAPGEFQGFFYLFPFSENGISELSTRGHRTVVEHVLSYNSLGTKFKKNCCSLNCVSNLPRNARCRQEEVEKSMGGRVKCGTARSFK